MPEAAMSTQAQMTFIIRGRESEEAAICSAVPTMSPEAFSVNRMRALARRELSSPSVSSQSEKSRMREGACRPMCPPPVSDPSRLASSRNSQSAEEGSEGRRPRPQ